MPARIGTAIRIQWLAVAMLFWAATLQADELSWEGTHWIWGLNQPGTALADIPKQTCYFRTSLAVTERARIKSADLMVTADNLYDVSVNGQRIGGSTTEPNDWNKPKRFAVAGLLTLGAQHHRCGGGQHRARSRGLAD